MKKLFGFFLKTIAILLSLLVVAIIFFRVEAALRETQTRREAAPSTGRFVQAGDVELYIQEIKPTGLIDSTNGIEYNGKRIEHKRVEEGDTFYLCDYELRFTYR